MHHGRSQQSLPNIGAAQAHAGPGLENFTTAQKNINTAIMEYLLKYGFMKTVDTLQEEMTQNKGGFQKNLMLDENAGLNYMINALSLGKREQFFVAWARFVPLSLRQNDIICQKLEFYLHIFFAIFPIHPVNPQSSHSEKELRRELQAFKVFLDTKGAELSKTSEFLQFYALPYVSNPLEHPTFKVLCTKKWGHDLKTRVHKFLQDNLPKISSPQLFHWYANWKKKQGMRGEGGSLEAEDLKERLLMLQKHYIMLQKKEESTKQTLVDSQSKWTNFSKEILNLSKELLFSLEAMGAKMTLNKVSLLPIRDKMAKWEAFLNSNIEELHVSRGIAPSQKNVIQQLQQQQMMMQQQYRMALQSNMLDNSFQEEVEPIQRQLQNKFEQQQRQFSQASQQVTEFAPLNFAKVKHYLITSQDELQLCATLQALRWRLTKAKRKVAVKFTINSFMQYDLLGCLPQENQLDQGQRVLDRLLQSSKRVLEYTMAFINALASECLGRTYLLQKQDLVEVLVRILHQETSDTSLRQNALGTLQKFSLRKRPQTIMIQLDMVKWIAFVIKNEGGGEGGLSDYSIEYATALLMNLSLRAAGKDKCEDPGIELLKVLNELVEHENLQVRTYVNGTLYSIFNRKKLREEAKELGMDEVLEYLMQQSDEQFRRQIQYILDQLNQKSPNEDQNDTSSLNPNENEEDDFDDEDDEEEDEDDFEGEEGLEGANEGDEGEFTDIIEEQGVQLGEDWLVGQFLTTPEEGQQQIRGILMQMERSRQRRFQNRQQQIQQVANNGSGDQSPYSQSQNRGRVEMTVTDGKPLMRPITPLKSSQANRLNMQHSTNTSQITGSNINIVQDQQPMAGAEEQDRNLPSEMQSRPKIPRTPQREETRSHNGGDGQQQPDGKDDFQDALTKNGVKMTEEEVKEYQQAFVSREKISRSPPEGRVPTNRLIQKKRVQPNNMGQMARVNQSPPQHNSPS